MNIIKLKIFLIFILLLNLNIVFSSPPVCEQYYLCEDPYVWDEVACKCVEDTNPCSWSSCQYCSNGQCYCPNGYVLNPDGITCDYNECSVNNGGCNQYCNNYNGGYYCSCDSSHTLSGDGRTCVDTDECAIGSSGCAQTCTNSDPWFFCGCVGGYRLYSDGKTCYDIDECSEGSSGCSQGCSNWGGGYSCYCAQGYRLGSDQRSCNEIDECAERTSGCSQGCSNSPSGGFTCSCNLGYRLGSDQRSCVEIDECVEGTSGCSQICSNSPAGSFTCNCRPGYRLGSDQKTCIEIDECTEGTSGCSQRCSNSPAGSFTCSCNLGYRLGSDQKTCIEIDECTEGTSGCSQGCQNSPAGSFTCKCNPGYRLGSDQKTCVEIDECAESISGCSQTCSNSPAGSFTCGCNSGYRLGSDQKTCVEIDECTEGTSGCSQGCQNSPSGSYTCKCNSGYRLGSDQKTCIEIDECTERTSGCSQGCSNTPSGSFTCSCNTGYRLGSDQKTCVDIDECTEKISGCSQGCLNSPAGSYSCYCNSGFLLGNDNKQCNDINECQGVNQCAGLSSCSNDNGTYHCVCPNGYNVTSSGFNCEDFDECLSATTNECSGVAICKNTVSSYYCACPAHSYLNEDQTSCTCDLGFELSQDQLSCVDTNECDLSNHDCLGLCINDVGSYHCGCATGFVLMEDQRTCTDENECLGSKGAECEQHCQNTNGSYACYCDNGYAVNSTDSTKCRNINECTEGNIQNKLHNCQQVCIDTIGSFKCGCNSGYKLNSDMKNCDDINECEGVNQCTGLSSCSNDIGSYHCVCPDNFTLTSDGFDCEDFNECLSTTTNQCSGIAICKNVISSYTCECPVNSHLNPDALTCACNIGYELSSNQTTCVDVNECEVPSHNCLGLCINDIGSYHCGCEAGYELMEDQRTCTDENECLGSKGAECEQNCQNSIGSYSCSCDNGYAVNSTDSTKCRNINECTEGNLQHKLHNCEQVCIDTIGSFKCDCDNGYKLNSDNKTCGDNDECALNTDNCGLNSTCKNTVGSFECQCGTGMQLNPNKDCVDIDECELETHNCGSNSTCSNSISSFSCTCPYGHIPTAPFEGLIYCESLYPILDSIEQIDYNKYKLTGSKFTSNQTQFKIDFNNGTVLITSFSDRVVDFTLTSFYQRVKGDVSVFVRDLQSNLVNYELPFISHYTNFTTEGGFVTVYGRDWPNDSKFSIDDIELTVDSEDVSLVQSDEIDQYFISYIPEGVGKYPIKVFNSTHRNTGVVSISYFQPNITDMTILQHDNIGGNISITGTNFGSSQYQDKLQIYIGSIPCTNIEIKTNHVLITCLISKTNSITNNVVLSVDGITNNPYYYEFAIKSTFDCEKCVNGACNTKTGICECTGGFSGKSCEEKIQPPKTEIDPTRPTVKLDTSGFGFSVKRIEEIDPIHDDTIASTLELGDVQWQSISSDNSWNYSVTLDQPDSLINSEIPTINRINISIEIQQFNNEATIEFAGQNLQMNANSIKMSITSSQWIFKSKSNYLRYIISSKTPVRDECDTDPHTLVNDNGFVILENNHGKKSIYTRHFSRALIDNRPIRIQNSIVENTVNDSPEESLVGIHIPYYKSKSVIDPDFSILLQSEEKAKAYDDCKSSLTSQEKEEIENSNKSSEKWRSIVGGVVGSVVAVSALVVAAYFYKVHREKKILLNSFSNRANVRHEIPK